MTRERKPAVEILIVIEVSIYLNNTTEISILMSPRLNAVIADAEHDLIQMKVRMNRCLHDGVLLGIWPQPRYYRNIVVHRNVFSAGKNGEEIKMSIHLEEWIFLTVWEGTQPVIDRFDKSPPLSRDLGAFFSFFFYSLNLLSDTIQIVPQQTREWTKHSSLSCPCWQINSLVCQKRRRKAHDTSDLW